MGPILRIVASLVALVSGLALLAAGAGGQSSGEAVSIELTGSIDPATERWIESALDDAAEGEAELVIIRLDTPGGLDTSMRSIVQDIIAAPMPVVVYVSPDGARAASAGLFITQAGDVAAMAPQTNIGSASPIRIGGGEFDDVLGRKIENDAAAYVRALAEGHGRNPDLAEEMVRDAVNVAAGEALDRELIDLVAASEAELLRKLDGFEVKGPKARTLDTAGLEITREDMSLQYEILQILVNPNIAFLLLLVGLLGIGFEVFNPGGIIPGAFGGISMLLGLYGTSLLPFTAAGVILLLGGLALIIAETQVPSGLLGIAGVISLAAGGLLLFDTNSDEFGITPAVVITTAVVLGGMVVLAGIKVAQSRRRPVRAGAEELIGAEGVVRAALEPSGQIFLDGALWRAQAIDGSPIGVGDRVRVESIDGLTLGVREVDRPESTPTERDPR